MQRFQCIGRSLLIPATIASFWVVVLRHPASLVAEPSITDLPGIDEMGERASLIGRLPNDLPQYRALSDQNAPER